jgi:hypothetical protein
MMVMYALKQRRPILILAFASLLASPYRFLSGAGLGPPCRAQ